MENAGARFVDKVPITGNEKRSAKGKAHMTLAVGMQVLVRGEGTGTITELDDDYKTGGSVYVLIDGDGVIVSCAYQQVSIIN